MRGFSFDNPKYLAMLNQQVIHMDQGVCYNPEYLVYRQMRHYPSRVAQVIRAVYLGEIEATKYGADLIFASLLSGQGERWQNFGEDQSSYLLVQLMGRAMFYNKGFSPDYGPGMGISADAKALWEKAVPLSSGDTVLFVDHESFQYAADFAADLGSFLDQKGINVCCFGPYDTGFSKMAGGRLEEGIDTLKALCREFDQCGVKKVITVSGQGYYMLKTLAPLFGIQYGFEICDILQLAGSMETKKAFIYGGSFYSRYAGLGNTLRSLAINTTEQPVKNAWEFQPVVNGDRRVNMPSIWESPLCAEYQRAGDDLHERIFDLTMEQISKINHSQLVLCSPLAYNRVREKQRETGKLVYYWEVLR